MRCLKMDLILQLKHEQQICFKCPAHSTLPYKDQYKFHCQQCHAVTKQMNKWLAVTLWGNIKPLCRTVIHTVISPIPAVNYSYLLLGLCTCLKEKSVQLRHISNLLRTFLVLILFPNILSILLCLIITCKFNKDIPYYITQIINENTSQLQNTFQQNPT